MNEQFEQQQCSDDISLFEFEKELRNDKQSFNNVRKLSPTRYRFRVVNAQGQDIRNQSTGQYDYTRVECAEPIMDYCHTRHYVENRDRYVPLFTYEVPTPYVISTYMLSATCY